MSEFTIITKKDFEDFLPENFRIVDDTRSKEIIYEYPASDSRLAVRIYSSIDVSTQDTRDLGKDAIRCVLIDKKSGKPLDKGKRTHRMANWRERLQEKLNDLHEAVKNVKFCKCGSAMAIRTKGENIFYGCVRYPLCTTTLSLDGRYREAVTSDMNEKKVACPKCNSIMRKRSGRYGDFYGCSNYPDCNGIRKLNDVEIYGHGVIQNVIQEDEEESSEALQKRMEERQLQEELAQPKKYNDVPTDDSDVELVFTEKFPYMNFKFDKFNPVQSRVFEFYADDCNMVICASTSAGKTTVAEMVMSHAIHNKKKAVFLSPLKAVSQEKYNDWTNEEHDWSKLNVSIVTGDYQLTEKRVEELNNAHVIIQTTEMLDSRTRRIETEKNDWLMQVGVLVVDEAHLLCMEGRGDREESALMRFTKQNPQCRIVLLSATMPNVSELAEWLTSLNGKKTELINSGYRPCKLDVHYPTYNAMGKYSVKEANKIRKAIEITQQYNEDKFIVFVHSKATGRKIYNQLMDLGENVEIHNAELGLHERLEVEKSFKSRDSESLRIIVATSTLAWGTNMPARRVIIVGVHRGLNEVEPLDIKQEVGRSGRVGFDPKGDAYVLLPNNKFDHYKKWCENIPPILSTMNDPDTLAFHLVSEIESGEVHDVETLMEWYNRSLAAFQNDYIDRVDAEELLRKLEKLYIIENKNGQYKTTKLGQVASHLYFSPYTIAGWYLNFNRIFKEQEGKYPDDVQLSWALANIPENAKRYIPKNYKDEVSNYKGRCNLFGLAPNDGIGWVGYCFLACLQGMNIEPTQKHTVRYDIERITTALNIIDERYATWEKTGFWKKMQLRIQYEVSWEHTNLCTLKGIGGVYVRKLFDAGITTIEKFKRDKDSALKALGKKRYDKIVKENNL